MHVRSSSSPERSEAPVNNVASFSPSSSFFIIHESTAISPSGGSRSPPKLRRGDDDSKTTGSHRVHKEYLASAGSRKKTSRSKAPSSAPVFHSTRSGSTPSSAISPAGVKCQDDADQAPNEAGATSNQSTVKKRAMELSILNRCGSAPDLPMNSPLSANVYSSSKKRTMQNNTNGTSPHLATLQRSRLTPLPIDTRSSVIMTDPLTDGAETRQSLLAVGDEVGAMPFNSKDPLLHEKMCQDARTISYLKNRLVQLERDVSASTKYRHMTEKQITQLSQENQRLELEKNRQQIRIGELDKTVLRQRHEYDKLAARYAAVYANLQKLLDQQQNASDTSAQHSTLQALARENQDFLRKQRVRSSFLL